MKMPHGTAVIRGRGKPLMGLCVGQEALLGRLDSILVAID